MTYSQANLIKELPSLFERINNYIHKVYNDYTVNYTYSNGEAGALKIYITLSNHGFNVMKLWVEITSDGKIYNCTIYQEMLKCVFDWLDTFIYCQKRQTARLNIIKQELLGRIRMVT